MKKVPTMLYLLNPGLDRQHGIISFKPLVATLLVLSVFAAVGWTGAFRETTYRLASLLVPSAGTTEQPILLLGPEPDAHAEPDWLALLDHVTAAEPSVVAFLFTPRAPATFFNRARAQGNVFFAHNSGLAGFRGPARPNLGETLEPSGIELSGGDRPLTFSLPDLGTLIYERVAQSPAPGHFRFHLASISGDVANATYRHLLTDSLPESAIRHRVILVAPPSGPYRSTIGSVTLPNGDLVGEDVFFAAGMAAMLAGHWVSELPTWLDLALLLVTLVLAAIAGQFLYIRAFMKTLVVTANFWLFASWVGLLAFGIWLPVAEILIGLFLLSGFCTLQRYFLIIERVRLFQLDYGEMVRRHIPEDVDAHRDPWQWANNWVGHAVPGKRSLFLELHQGTLQRRAASGTGDVPVEMQSLDPGKEPFTRALANQGPVQVHRLLSGGDDEVQWLVPLFSGQRPLGFWVVAFDRTSPAPDAAALADIAEPLTAWLTEQIESQGRTGRVKRLLRYHVDAGCMVRMRALTVLLEQYLLRHRATSPQVARSGPAADVRAFQRSVPRSGRRSLKAGA
ncbi:hypothetical protein SCOR_05530 [Sulfidibacter corallicola]|uniref:CHASE2 domain-containing protein n=1 Tax=Sulfidibacter corallicola TaxID=2818388 RepID=A0A8A4TRF4_SULCO|nr:hypothetical protein [Sulfidibacter corallicola]QTD51764.1 hypothetical protein J3U87_04780 [Sulfidibacter corallicola]